MTVMVKKSNTCMKFKEVSAVYFENHTIQLNTLCGQTAELSNVEVNTVL
jgi:hypothetical protein